MVTEFIKKMLGVKSPSREFIKMSNEVMARELPLFVEYCWVVDNVINEIQEGKNV